MLFRSLSAGGTISGNYLLKTGVTETGTPAGIAGMTDFASLQTAAADEMCTNNIPSNLSGITLVPGVYCSNSGSFSLDEWSTLTLDAGGDLSAVWVFKTSGSLITGAHSSNENDPLIYNRSNY